MISGKFKLHSFLLLATLFWSVLSNAQATDLLAGLGYDRAHDGHGFDLHKSGDQWLLYFFTYDESGNPEWYLGLGNMQFESISGKFQRIRYEPGRSPPQQADDDFIGNFVLDFNEAAAACDDGVTRENARQKARFEWRIGIESGTWCTELLAPGENVGFEPYRGGVWYAGEEDPGYGVTVAHMDHLVVTIAYFYDDEGNPRWTLGTGRDSDAQIDLNYFSGYCRLCPLQAVDSADVGGFFVQWQASNIPTGGLHPAELHIDLTEQEGWAFDREFSLQRLTDGIASVARQPYIYAPPDTEFCFTTEINDAGVLCAIKPSTADPGARDEFGSDSLADERLGFGYHAVAFPAEGIPVKGVDVHLTGSYGRPYNQRTGEFANRLLLDEAMEAGWIVIQLAYNNRFSINLDECGKTSRNQSVDNCAGDIRREKITGENFSVVTDTPLADSIEQRLINLSVYLANMGVALPPILTRNGRVDWPRLRVSGHSQGATHALYLGKYFEAAFVCMLAGGYDVPDSEPFFPPELVADWLLEDQTGLDLSRVRALVAVEDDAYEAFVAAYDALELQQDLHWHELNDPPFTDTGGNVVNGHAAVVKDARYAALRYNACWK